jgi:cytochrome P450
MLGLIVIQRIRKIFTSIMTAKKCDTYVHFQELEAIATIHNMLENPDGWAQEIFRYSLSVARTVSFGRRVVSSSDAFAVEVKQVMENFSVAMTPGKYLFESIPILGKLPRVFQPWLPELERFRDFERDFCIRNYQIALDDGEKHPERPSMAREIHHEMRKEGGVDDVQAATNCMEILGAGSETTANSLSFVVLALLTHPEVVRRAHEELDGVIGQDRMPSWSDEPNLPYIRAIIKEQQRWKGIAPLSMILNVFKGADSQVWVH